MFKAVLYTFLTLRDDSSWNGNLTYRATTLQFTKSHNFEIKWAKIIG